MAETTTRPGSFAAKLDSELQARGLGRRTLARKLSEGRGGAQSVDTLRGLLQKYLRGEVVPTARSRHEIEDALGCKRDALEPDDDDEEASRPVRTLDDLLRLRIDEILREREQVQSA